MTSRNDRDYAPRQLALFVARGNCAFGLRTGPSSSSAPFTQVPKVTMSALGHKRTYAVAQVHVRFTPDSDRESGHAANGHVCFTPKSGHVRATAMSALGQ
jgi:hypothetical protein